MKTKHDNKKMSEAHQYTLCLLALTLTKTCNDILMPAFANCDSLWHITKSVAHQLDICMDGFPQKKLSAGAKRDLDEAFNILAPYIETEAEATTAERLTAWGSNVWAALTLITDAKNLAPAFTNKECWGMLEKSLTELAEALVEMCEGCDEAGVQMYMELV